MAKALSSCRGLKCTVNRAEELPGLSEAKKSCPVAASALLTSALDI